MQTQVLTFPISPLSHTREVFLDLFLLYWIKKKNKLFKPFPLGKNLPNGYWIQLDFFSTLC